MNGTEDRYQYDNPAVVDFTISDGPTSDVSQRDSGQWIGDSGNRRTSVTNIRTCVSPLNSLAFALLVASGILCAVSAFSPFWIYYPLRPPLPELPRFHVVFPFKRASWRGLWAVCYTAVDLNPRVIETRTPYRCLWFGQSDNNAWETIPSWWDAAEVLFTIGLILLVLALLTQCAYACCHWGLTKAWVVTLIASLILGGGVMFTASLALFGDTSFQEGELTPEPTGEEGRLEWAFMVGAGGAASCMLTALLFYIDAIYLAWVVNRGTCR